MGVVDERRDTADEKAKRTEEKPESEDAGERVTDTTKAEVGEIRGGKMEAGMMGEVEQRARHMREGWKEQWMERKGRNIRGRKQQILHGYRREFTDLDSLSIIKHPC